MDKKFKWHLTKWKLRRHNTGDVYRDFSLTASISGGGYAIIPERIAEAETAHYNQSV